MNAAELFQSTMAKCPLVAILRGVLPDDVEAVGDVLVETGFSMIEVPLNSPDPLASIALLAKRYGPGILIGAGTVLTVEEVSAVAQTGARLIVSPNTNVDVIRHAAAAELVMLPGYQTPSEAFAALAAGATGLKLFPAEAASPTILKAHRAVLPKHVSVLAVGGVTPTNLGDWMASGADGAGLGSALFKPGMALDMIKDNAANFIAALPAQ